MTIREVPDHVAQRYGGPRAFAMLKSLIYVGSCIGGWAGCHIWLNGDSEGYMM